MPCILGNLMFILPGACVELSPDLYVTVIAYTPVLTCTSNQVLAQGIKVDESNVTEFLDNIQNKLNAFEQVLATGFGRNSFLSTFNGDDQYLDEDSNSTRSSKSKENNADAGIINLLRQGFFALQLLPENSSAEVLLHMALGANGIVVVTDGILGVTDNNLFDSLMTQLRNSTIACSFLKTGDTYCSRCQFGHIPHVELLQFIATATFGAYFSSCPDLVLKSQINILCIFTLSCYKFTLTVVWDTVFHFLSQHSGKQLNVYHKALLLWSFQKGLEGFKYDLTHHRTVDPMHPISLTNRKMYTHMILFCFAQMFRLNTTYPVRYVMKSNSCSYRILSHPIKDKSTVVMPVVHKKHLETKLNTSIHSVLSVRLREGGSQLEVRLVLPWRDYAKIEYKAVSSWPVDPTKMMGFSEFRAGPNILDFLVVGQVLERIENLGFIACMSTEYLEHWTILCQNTTLSQTDQLLVHLQSFGSNPVQFNIPNSVKSGVPVFYQPQSSTTPALNTQHSSKQKWMHSHRIGMVLEHDIPLPKYLHTPNSSGRFSMISCRQALTSLSFLLRDWSSFVLIEGSSYIKFLYRISSKMDKILSPNRDVDKPPVSFLLLRVTSKPPCMVLRLAFLGGTSGSMRHKTLQILKNKVRELKFPQRGSQQISKDKQTGNKQGKPTPPTVVKKPPLQREWSEIGCCVLLTKPVGDILISYENKPRDMTILEDPSRYIPIHITMQQASTKSTMANAFNSLSRYLHHQRWIWTVKQGKVDITLQAIGRILSTLAKIRLQEGFHFASSNAGIVNMVLEVEMVKGSDEKFFKRDIFVYIDVFDILFTTDVSEEDLDEMETTEADGELQIVTECWIEPQHDVECISCLVTFEHLVYVCQNSAIFTSDFSWLLDSCVNNDGFRTLYQDGDSTKQTSASPNIYQMPFPFDLLSLLPKNPEDFQRNGKGSNRLLFSLLFEKLKDGSQREVSLSLEDCEQFLSLLKTRSRNNTTRDLPFPIEENDKIVIESEIEIKSEIKDFSKPVNQKPQRQSSADSTRDLIPKWRCFVRAANNTRLYLTLLPASFDDLLVLNQISISDKFNDRTIEREMSTGNSEDNIKSSSYQPEDTAVQRVTKDQTANQLEIPKNNLSATKASEEFPECDNEVSEEATGKDKIDNDDKKMEENRLSVSIPVYVYECFLGNVTDSLINPWSFQLSPDIYEDLTFDVENEETNNMFKIPTLDKRELLLGLRMTHERRSDSSIDGGGDLRQQCTFITDTYYICFVNGVFQSLQQGFFVDQHDVDAAINNICEELLPIETDITTFLFASCRHFQHLVDTSRQDSNVREVKETSKDEIIPRRPSVRFMDIVEDNEGESYNKATPSVLQLPQSVVKLQTSISQPCEYLPGLHSLIQNKFMDIIQKWFRVVPTNPDYFFYCPDILPQDNSIEAVDTDDRQSNNYVSFDISHGEGTEDVEEFILPENYDLTDDKKAVDLDITSTASVMDSQDSFIDSDEYDHCEDVTEDGNDQQPFDDEPETPRKPYFVRMMSNSSVSTSPPNEPESFQFDGASSSETPGPLRQLHGDPIGHLPVLQHNAVMKCKEELEWLFKDEITSALRHMQPIREDALQFVINHVKYSVDHGKPNCSAENIPLHFVYGAEHSLSRFEEELERTNLRSFRFLKEENIYYIVKGKSHNLVNHAKKLNSALVELSRESTPAKPCINMQEKWVSDHIEDSVTSPQTDVPLTTYVSPTFISPSYIARDSSLDGSGSHVVISSDLSGQEASPSNYLFHKDNMGIRNSEPDEIVIQTQLPLPVKSGELRSESLSDDISEGTLKKSSSFAGFNLEENTEPFKRQESMTALSSSPIKSVTNVPQLPSLGRLRHFSAPSGQGTPRSKASTLPQTPSWISSRGSYTEEGYDGDSSDSEEGTTAFNDTNCLQQSLPNFWLVLKMKEDAVDLLLMNDLYETRMCKKLLVAEADEDVSWNVDRSDIPGKTPVLRQVLNKFSVNNRKNMFVIKEMAGNMAVFYVKLKEIVNTVLSRQVSSISTENINLNESSSSLVLHVRKDEQGLDKDSDTVSVCSAGSSTQYPQQDTIELAVHGIQEPGSEIKEDLMRLLQHKLDDAVLDIISLQLSRNPNSKLLIEDVHFIQKPGQEPSDVFCLTIPSSAHMQLPALMYYLKQNMLQFLHTPNYVDNKTESRFQDIVCGKWQAIPDGHVYLYIRPQASGGKGIALVYLSLIDGQGNSVKLLSCPKPSRSGFTKVQEETEFESMIHSEIYCPSPSSRPGPTSLIQFRVWERGSADLKTLKEKLISAVKYSLCDIVTEYNMLTAPISQVPQQLQDLLPMPACSEPSSPIAHRGSPDPSSLERRHSIVTRKLSEHIKTLSSSGGSKQIERLASPSPLQSLKEAFIPSKTRIMSPPPDPTKNFDIPNVSHASLGQTSAATSPQTQKTDREAEIQQIVAKYESGDRGVPSVNKSNFTLRSKFSLDYFLREFQTTITNISIDVQPKIFKLQKDSSGVLFNGIQYNPFRHPMQVSDPVSHGIHNNILKLPVQVGESHNESSLDYERKCFVGAGRDMHFIVVGRNVDQWQASIQDTDEEEFCDSSNPTSPKAIPKHTYQKYRPLSSATPQDKNLDVVGLLPGSVPIFIPRQRFLLLLLENKQIDKIIFKNHFILPDVMESIFFQCFLTLYSYNWAGDLSTLLTKTTKRLTQWNNTRIQLLNSIVSQKMGLFHHNLYEESNQGKDDNPFNSASTELELLIKQTAPPAREQARRANSMSSLNHPIRPFDAAYKDLIPQKPLHHTQLANIRDPVAKHGVQALEIRVYNKRDNEKFCKQNNLYWTWLEKTASSIPISLSLSSIPISVSCLSCL
ncbi:LOW QUALITY PROTEIN: hypothetical protein KUTeg_016056 [Tegillarca granosa]|uniref:Protein SZT2 n=1 Tax=Tegillarca granosa TaxID=220873 RepID=A0ABQ9EJR6_TEGGR|nr:LOW QUALITY PROTEIN: hypothetical protein KUTeg_016056 [Tegillarca granosa]